MEACVVPNVGIESDKVAGRMRNQYAKQKSDSQSSPRTIEGGQEKERAVYDDRDEGRSSKGEKKGKSSDDEKT